MPNIKAAGDNRRHLCRLPAEVEKSQPGLIVRTRGRALLALPLPARPRGLLHEDGPVLAALQRAAERDGHRIAGVAWLFPYGRQPEAIAPCDAKWLQHWLHSHCVVTLELPALVLGLSLWNCSAVAWPESAPGLGTPVTRVTAAPPNRLHQNRGTRRLAV